MLRRFVSSILENSLSIAVCKQPHRNSTYFCFNTAMPVIPACYWSVLPNGVRVISEQTAGPLACVSLLAEAGPRYENQCNNGSTHMVEHMAFKGFCTLSRYCLEERLRCMGARVSSHTDREYQVFTATCPNECVAAVVNILASIFTCLDIDCVEMECAKSDIMREMGEDESDPRLLAFHYLHQTAFQGSTLGLPVIGPMENYNRFTPAFLRCFMAQHYQPFRLILSVSSTFSHHDIVCMAQCDLGPIMQTTNELVEWPTRYTGSDIRYRNDDMGFAHIAFAVEACGYAHKDSMTLNLMKHILGKWDHSQCQGYNTWPMLAHASEISKLCVHYEAFYIPYRDVGLFGVYLVVPKEDDIEDAMLMMQDQFMCLCHTTQWSDVERAQALLKLELSKKTDGCVESCRDMAIQMLYRGSRLNLVELFEVVDNIKQLEVRDIATRYLYDRCPVMGAVGPVESVQNYARLRAGMYWLRL